MGNINTNVFFKVVSKGFYIVTMFGQFRFFSILNTNSRVIYRKLLLIKFIVMRAVSLAKG